MLGRWVGNLRGAHGDHHAIARGIVWLVLFVLVGKLAGAAKEMVVAYRYGIGPEVDAYIFVSNIVLWLVAIWASVLPAALIPLAARLRQEAPGELPLFRAELLGVTIAAGSVLLFAMWLGLPYLLRSPGAGLPPVTAALAIQMVPAIVLLAPLGAAVALFSTWLLAAGKQLNTLLEGVPALVLLSVMLVFSAGEIEPLIWGTVAGYLCHLASLAVPLIRRGEIDVPRFTRQSPNWTVFWQGFGILFAGQALLSAANVIDQFFAARLDLGAIATLNYGNRVLALILGLGATVIGRATLPVFSQVQSQRPGEVYALALPWARLMLLLGVVAALVAWSIAPYVVDLLFKRGAFSEQDADAVTQVFRYSLVQLPAYFFSIVLVSCAASQRLYSAIFWSGFIGLAAKVVANTVLIPRFGINGIVLAWTAAYTCNALFFWIILRKNQ